MYLLQSCESRDTSSTSEYFRDARSDIFIKLAWINHQLFIIIDNEIHQSDLQMLWIDSFALEHLTFGVIVIEFWINQFTDSAARLNAKCKKLLFYNFFPETLDAANSEFELFLMHAKTITYLLNVLFWTSIRFTQKISRKNTLLQFSHIPTN